MWEEMSKEEPPVPVYDTGREEPVFLATDLVHMEIDPNEELPFKYKQTRGEIRGYKNKVGMEI